MKNAIHCLTDAHPGKTLLAIALFWAALSGFAGRVLGWYLPAYVTYPVAFLLFFAGVIAFLLWLAVTDDELMKGK